MMRLALRIGMADSNRPAASTFTWAIEGIGFSVGASIFVTIDA